MKTDVITISSEGSNMEAALAQIDKISAYKNLSSKNSMTLRLLTEETLAMMRAIAGNVNGVLLQAFAGAAARRKVALA